MSAAPEVFVSFVQLPEFVHRNGAERELRICASGCPGTETACAWLDWACVRAVAVEWGIDVLSTAGQQPPARLREVALASSALDNLDAHQIHFGAIDLISDILALKLFRAYGVPDSVAKAFLAHFSSDLAVDLDEARNATQRRTPPAPTRPATLGPQTPCTTPAQPAAAHGLAPGGAAPTPRKIRKVKMTKRAPRRCRKCGHEPRSEEWSSFHVEPADAVRPCARKHERNLPQNRAAPASYCTVPPDQRLPGFPMAPGKKSKKRRKA